MRLGRWKRSHSTKDLSFIAQWGSTRAMLSESFYFHFPYCETKCHYCDFYSIAHSRTTADNRLSYLNALIQEVEFYSNAVAPEVKTIFLGGGTPTMTEADQLARVFEVFFRKTRLASGAEWTIEANPSSIMADALKTYRSMGINRLSMGVQSMRDDHLKMLGRVHDRMRAIQALEIVFESGFKNVSVDLLCGVPGQTLGDLENAMTELLRYPLSHMSVYILTLAKHHPMAGSLPSEETQLEHYLFVDRFLRDRGFDHYEISNFAKPGMKARHNLAYWQGQSYLGFGPSAHSFDSSLKRRWKNFASVNRYATSLTEKKLPIEFEEVLTPKEESLEQWMLSLRLEEGFPESWLTNPLLKQTAQEYVERDLLYLKENRYRPTASGFALSDSLVLGFASAVEESGSILK